MWRRCGDDVDASAGASSRSEEEGRKYPISGNHTGTCAPIEQQRSRRARYNLAIGFRRSMKDPMSGRRSTIPVFVGIVPHGTRKE